MIEFSPSVIIEVTSVCDRKCQGCYAPNLVSNQSPQSLQQERPELFLSPLRLKEALAELPPFQGAVAIRGGEPSLHPELTKLLELTRQVSEEVYLETHGRWVDTEEGASLLRACSELGITLKISFDSMHAMTPLRLERILSLCLAQGVRILVAITEPSLYSFLETRRRIPFVPDEKIIFQLKAQSVQELLRPRVATISSEGRVGHELTHLFTSEPPLRSIV